MRASITTPMRQFQLEIADNTCRREVGTSLLIDTTVGRIQQERRDHGQYAGLTDLWNVKFPIYCNIGPSA